MQEYLSLCTCKQWVECYGTKFIWSNAYHVATNFISVNPMLLVKEILASIILLYSAWKIKSLQKDYLYMKWLWGLLICNSSNYFCTSPLIIKTSARFLWTALQISNRLMNAVLQKKYRHFENGRLFAMQWSAQFAIHHAFKIEELSNAKLHNSLFHSG